MSDVEVSSELPAQILAHLNEKVRAEVERVWRQYAKPDWHALVWKDPESTNTALAVFKIVEVILESEVERNRNIHEGTLRIRAEAAAKIEANNTRIADIQSDRDRTLRNLDQQIEGVHAEAASAAEEFETKIADVKSERDRAIREIDQQIERLQENPEDPPEEQRPE